MLVKAAEISLPLKTIHKSKHKIFISKRHQAAYEDHEKVCKQWRTNGRPTDINHPSRKAKLLSQRNLQKIAREEEAIKAKTNHEKLMTAFYENTDELYSMLRNLRGQNHKETSIPFINTLKGKYTGDNLLEGFCANTEALCEQDSRKLSDDFYKMCLIDNTVILDIATHR